MTLSLFWDSEPPSIATSIELNEIDPFSARGMSRVYGRGDQFLPKPTRSFGMDIWKTKKGRLLMRFSSRCRDVDNWSYEIKGLDLASIPAKTVDMLFSDSWIPLSIRQQYDSWVRDEL